MKAAELKMNDNALRQHLQAWQVEPKVPRPFHARVWERIAELEDMRAKTPLARLRAWLIAQMVEPARAIAVASIVILAGVGAGAWKGSVDREQQWADLERRYVESIDPYARMGTPQMP